jgi:hypothetical protein
MGKPAPFQRPGITLSTEKRDWRDVSPYSLRENDIVRGAGRVLLVTDSASGVRVEFQSGEVATYDEGDLITAFVKV